jgi:hypothetical protein
LIDNLVPRICCAAMCAFIWPALAVARIPKNQTCKIKSVGLSITLPSDWACVNGGSTSSAPRLSVDAPGRVSHLDIFATNTTSSLSTLTPRIETITRQQFSHTGSHVSFTTTSSTVGTAIPALRMTARYRGPWVADVREITHVFYFFVHDGMFFELDYSAADPWTKTESPVFGRSAASIRFLPVS